MASVERRERRGPNGSSQLRYVVRWREPDGRTRAKSFTRKGDPSRFAATVAADIVRGKYLDPDAGKINFKNYTAKWLAAQTFDEGTSESVELRHRLHAHPELGETLLSDIKPSTIQTWLRGLSDLAPTYQKVLFANVSTILTAAVDDELIPKNPCKAPSYASPGPSHAR